MHKINKRFLSLIFICFSSSLYCMEIFIPLALAACIKKMFDQGHQLSQSTFLISTNDNQNIRLSPKVMSHCLRLNTVLSHLYKNIFPKVLTVGCTKEEITTFSQAIENPTLINYDRDLN